MSTMQAQHPMTPSGAPPPRQAPRVRPEPERCIDGSSLRRMLLDNGVIRPPGSPTPATPSRATVRLDDRAIYTAAADIWLTCARQVDAVIARGGPVADLLAHWRDAGRPRGRDELGTLYTRSRSVGAGDDE